MKRLKEAQARERKEKLARIAKYGVPLLKIGRHCLQLEHVQQLRFLQDKLKAELPPRKRKRFSEWLKSHGGPVQALPAIVPVEAEKARHPPPPAAQGTALSPQAKLFLEYAKAVNADRYRVTAIKMGKNGEKKVMILDKKDGQSLGFTPGELLNQMPEILKLAERDENIYYTPLSEEQHHILIDDMSPEKVLQLQKDGFKHAVFLETSPDNFQCILTFPKFQGDFDRQVGNPLASTLNKRCGDPNLFGAIHPHRAQALKTASQSMSGKMAPSRASACAGLCDRIAKSPDRSAEN